MIKRERVMVGACNYINMNKPNKFKKKELITSTNLGVSLEEDNRQDPYIVSLQAK